jgi:hypothetical protein
MTELCEYCFADGEDENKVHRINGEWICDECMATAADIASKHPAALRAWQFRLAREEEFGDGEYSG